MNNNKTLILAVSTVLTIAASTATTAASDFSWYKMKSEITNTDGSSPMKMSLASIATAAHVATATTPTKKVKDREKAIEERIQREYNVYPTKKTVKDLTEDRKKKKFSVGFQMNSHPSYSTTSQTFTTDANGDVVVVEEVLNNRSSGFAVTIRGVTDLTELGLPGGQVNTNVAFGNEHIDIDLNKPLFETESITVDAGLGMKAVHQASPAWERGFYPYVNTGVDIDLGDFSVNAGAKTMIEKPDLYDSPVIPYYGISYEF